MKITWKKIGLIMIGLALVVGLFGDKVSAATNTSGVIAGYVQVNGLSDAIKKATLDSNSMNKAITLVPGNKKETITKGSYEGVTLPVDVLVLSTGNLGTYEGSGIDKVKGIKIGERKVMFSNGTAYIGAEGEGEGALDKGEGAVTAATDLLNPWNLTLKVLSVILATIQLAVTSFLQWLMYGLDILLNAGNILNNKGIHNGWTAVRDLCNMFFILILLAIAFMTIFMGTEGSSYSIKRALPMLVIAVLTINFSFLMCRIIIEGTDIISRNFVTKGEAGILGDVMGINKLGVLKIPDSSTVGGAVDDILNNKGTTGQSGASQ